MFRVPQVELNYLSEFIIKDADSKQRFNAALHDKELPETIYSVGKPKRPDQTQEEHLRQRKAWQRVKMMRAERNASKK